MNDELMGRVARVAAEVAPLFGLDPAAVEVVSVEDGIASLRLGEACASCPAGLPALLAGLEQEVRERVPEVEVMTAVVGS